MDSKDKVFDEVTDLLQEGVERLKGGAEFTELEKEQPTKASWVVFDASLKRYATDVYATIKYDDALAMQNEIVRLIRTVWTPQILEYVRSGEIENLTLRIGPETLSGYNLNEENGVDVNNRKEA